MGSPLTWSIRLLHQNDLRQIPVEMHAEHSISRVQPDSLFRSDVGQFFGRCYQCSADVIDFGAQWSDMNVRMALRPKEVTVLGKPPAARIQPLGPFCCSFP